jgi:hypothetical protein
MNEFAASLLEGDPQAKYSPLEVADWLDDLADISTRNLERAVSLVQDTGDVDFRRFYYDIKIQNGIARFFAEKMRAAVLWHLYEVCGDTGVLSEAIAKYKSARDFWAGMAREAGSVYVEDISFGELWQLRGHWSGRIPSIDADIYLMEEALKEGAEGSSKTARAEILEQALRVVENTPQRPLPECGHEPAGLFVPGEPMEIELSTGDNLSAEVYLYYRHVNQAVNWNRMRMKGEQGTYRAVIPAGYTLTRYPMQYYFTLDMGREGISIFPGLDGDLSGMPYFTARL